MVREIEIEIMCKGERECMKKRWCEEQKSEGEIYEREYKETERERRKTIKSVLVFLFLQV